MFLLFNIYFLYLHVSVPNEHCVHVSCHLIPPGEEHPEGVRFPDRNSGGHFTLVSIIPGTAF